VDIDEDYYQAVTLKEVLRGVIDVVPQVNLRAAAGMGGPHAATAVALSSHDVVEDRSATLRLFPAFLSTERGQV
jgi:hypothetical protein